jgi:hypothetical protein
VRQLTSVHTEGRNLYTSKDQSLSPGSDIVKVFTRFEDLPVPNLHAGSYRIQKSGFQFQILDSERDFSDGLSGVPAVSRDSGG